MGVDVVLKQVNKAGTSPKGRRLSEVDFVLDEADLFARLCENSDLPMLSRVDPYSDLILTAEDMPQFVAEIEATMKLVENSAERRLLSEIRRVAERCAVQASLELHLEGD
ncbi:hypothetical protein ACIBOV_11320 [Micromonospora chersina]|uniref:hypothetical protein n=1 Tax=Micromonospora chersina TaxID=47854 RepID=UPI0037AE9081